MIRNQAWEQEKEQVQREQQGQSLGGKKVLDESRSWPAFRSVVWFGSWECAEESRKKPEGHIKGFWTPI